MNEADVVRLWHERDKPRPPGSLPEGVTPRAWCDEMAARPEWREAMVKIEREMADDARKALALRRFRRAMRRHEKRARRMGHARAANGIRSFRLPLATGHALTVERTEGAEMKLRRWARHDWQEHFSGGDDCCGNGTTAFLYDRAAEAVAKLDAALAEIGGAV